MSCRASTGPHLNPWVLGRREEGLGLLGTTAEILYHLNWLQAHSCHLKPSSTQISRVTVGTSLRENSKRSAGDDTTHMSPLPGSTTGPSTCHHPLPNRETLSRSWECFASARRLRQVGHQKMDHIKIQPCWTMSLRAVMMVTARSSPTFHQPCLFQLFAKGAT